MSQNILARYAFIPWMRQGMGLKIEDDENLGSAGGPTERPEFSLTAKIIADGSEQDSVAKTAEIMGPGDVIGVDRDMIVKTEPANWITNFEPHHLPCIEFYDEDFPWRYSPARAKSDHQLRPWIFLVVLKEGEFTRGTADGAPLPFITVTGASNGSVLPAYNQIWGWAHVQFNGDLDPNDNGVVPDAMSRFREIIESDPDRAFSRIICPRQLEANTRYFAFLIPSFETGRLAGRGADQTDIANIDAQKAAWGEGHTVKPDEFPFYYEFFFRTGPSGDFEHLVRQLMPRPMDERVGKRPMDISKPGYGLNYVGGTAPNQGAVMLEGAMKAPLVPSTTYPGFRSGATAFVDDLVQLLNLGKDLRLGTFPTSGPFSTNPFYTSTSIEDDPIVVPPMYGQFHALTDELVTTGTNWIHELNLDPRWRSVAGMGSRYVMENQDRLMDEAWDQLGEVLEANKKIRQAQLAQQVQQEMHRKHMESQSEEQVTAMNAKVMRRIKVGPETLYGRANLSSMPNAAIDHAFRRIRRVNGPVARRMDPSNTIAGNTGNDMVKNMALQFITPAQEKIYSAETANINTANLRVKVANVIADTGGSVNFNITNEGDTNFSATTQTEEIAFRSALAAYDGYFATENWENATSGTVLNLGNVKNNVLAETKPLKAIRAQVYGELEALPIDPLTLPPEKIVPVQAYPKFNFPTFEAVAELGTDFLIPNLELLKNNTISLLQTNPRFVESFLAGANHEFGRELLWREYPTDQRGSYFRQFWDSSDFVNVDGLSEEDLEKRNMDIKEVHEWPSNTVLGSNGHRPDHEQLVLVIKGDLLKKFPNTVIYAQKAKYAVQPGDGEILLDDPRKLASESDPDNLKFPIFSAKIDPDITFLGFDLDPEEAKGDRSNSSKPGWFFVLKERPGETRFGLDISRTVALDTWNDLAWTDVSVDGNRNVVLGSPISVTTPDGLVWSDQTQSADIAHILYQAPFMVAIHAYEMVPEIPTNFTSGT